MPKAVKIVQKEAPVLREAAKDVPVEDISSPRIQKIIEDMKKALESQEDGVAIAAPQIGHSLRIFVMSGRVMEIIKAVEGDDRKYGDVVFINPKLIKKSKEQHMVEEGCLSVRYLYGKVKRAKKATVLAYDEKGRPFTKGGSGLIAQIFQHELDHLEGVLFIDTAVEVVDLPPEKQAEQNAETEA